jgi:hypothetical protein
MFDIEGVFAAGLINVESSGLMRWALEQVVRCIVDPSETKGWPKFIDLSRVIVDHIENEFDTLSVELADKTFEFLNLTAGTGPCAV